MPLNKLRESIKEKAELKDAYIDSLRSLSREVSDKANTPLSRIIDAALSGLEADDNDIIKSSSNNRRIVRSVVGKTSAEINKHANRSKKVFTAVGVSATEVYKDLKRIDIEYLGKGRNKAFTELSDAEIEDAAGLNKDATKSFARSMEGASAYIKSALEGGIVYHMSRQSLRNKLLSADGDVNVADGGTLYSTTLNSLNSYSGDIINFYTEVGATQQEGVRSVFNSNPMDDRTKPICAAATLAGIIPVDQMESSYGVPPRMLCRCDLVYIDPEWKDVQADIEKHLDEQKENWRKILNDLPRRKDGHFYSNVQKQLDVLSGKLTPQKFDATALHTARLRLLSKGEINRILTNYKSTYRMQYSMPDVVLKDTAPRAAKTIVSTEGIKSSEDRVRASGVSNVDFSQASSDKMASVAADAFKDLADRGYSLPANVIIRGVSDDDYLKKNSRVIAYFRRADNKITLNKDAPFKWWNATEKRSYGKALKGFLASDSPKAVIFHELAHKNHFDKIGGSLYETAKHIKFLPDQVAIIKKHVSAYATTNAEEFVAETFSGIMSGIKYDEQILALYDRYRGP